MRVPSGLAVSAHSGPGHGWGGPVEPWELHPMLVHFPIVLLLSGVGLDLYARYRGRADLAWVVNGLLVAGVLTGALAAGTGLLAFFLVPAHTGEAHRLMYWHLGVQVAALALFAWPAWVGWQNWLRPLPRGPRVAGWVAAILLTVGSGLGGYIVYHGGAGVQPALLHPGIGGGGHSHQAGGER
ncbi:MAG: hypothetical protein K2X82_17095 [Gemmataceae bacterium]|nr:hypothetical protein [Gemmataceae bacterium]